MPILDPVPGDVPSTPTNAPPSAEQGAEQPTSPGIRTATAYAERYEAPYRLSDQMEGLAALMLFGGLGVAVCLFLYGISEEYSPHQAARLLAVLLAPMAVGFYGLLSIGVALMRAFVDQAVHSAPLSAAEKHAIVFKKR